MSNLPSNWNVKYSKKLQNTGLSTESGLHYAQPWNVKNSLSECITACNNDDACNSIIEKADKKCALTGITADMNSFLKTSNGETLHIKNTTSTMTKPTDVKYIVNDANNDIFGDVKEGMGWVALLGRTDLGFDCDVPGTDNPGEDTYITTHYIGANGHYWDDHGIPVDYKGKYGCPKIGVISGGTNLKPTGCGNPSGQWALVNSTAECFYNRIYNPIETGLPDGAAKLSFTQLDEYFDNSNIYSARESWCRSGGFDTILNTTTACQGINGFDYKSALLEFIPDDWYSRDTDCDKLRQVGILMNSTKTSTGDKTNFINKMKKLPTNGTAWTPGAIRALNQIMLNDSVIDEIKREITTLTAAYCNSRSNNGKDDPVCGCKNAIDGWDARDSGGCSHGEKGCDDVVQYIDIRNKLKEINSVGSAFIKMNDNFDPNRDSQACIDGHADNGSSVLAYKKKDPSGPKIVQLCETVIQSLDQSTLSIKGDLNIVCKQSAEAVTNSQSGTASGGGGGGDGTDGGTGGKNVNIWIWILIAICSFLIVIGVGGALLFLL